jgi:hypothetical protein
MIYIYLSAYLLFSVVGSILNSKIFHNKRKYLPSLILYIIGIVLLNINSSNMLLKFSQAITLGLAGGFMFNKNDFVYLKYKVKSLFIRHK